MSDARPLLLLPPSKGKAAGGDGPPYARVAADTHPLGAARREVLAELTTQLAHLDDAAVARLAGVGASKAGAARALLTDLPGAPTVAARLRYRGIVHGNAGLARLGPGAAGADVRIVSALLGLVALDDPVPDYRIEFGATLPALGGLAPFWRAQLSDHLAEVAARRRVWDLLPAEHRRVWDPAVRDALEVVEVAFVRPDGRPANAARTKVAKGRLAAGLLAEPALTPEQVPAAVDLGDGWTVAGAGDALTATYHG